VRCLLARRVDREVDRCVASFRETASRFASPLGERSGRAGERRRAGDLRSPAGSPWDSSKRHRRRRELFARFRARPLWVMAGLLTPLGVHLVAKPDRACARRYGRALVLGPPKRRPGGRADQSWSPCRLDDFGVDYFAMSKALEDARFTLVPSGRFRERHGPCGQDGVPSNKKVCLVAATDPGFLVDLRRLKVRRDSQA
jgi:hypothetical protein